jgi:hypothetical protein
MTDAFCNCDVRRSTRTSPPFGAADGSSLIISQGTPIRSICALASSGSADVSTYLVRAYCSLAGPWVRDHPGMDTTEIQSAFDDVFDQAVIFHGFADYMRDYEVFIYATADPRTSIRPEHLRYRFKHCVRAMAATALSTQIWKRSLDERLVDYERGRELDGYVWGVKWQVLYPGMKLVHGSADAARWSHELGIPFHEAAIETNGHNISLIFSDLAVDTVDAGYAPFVVPSGGPDFKIPLR